MIHWKTKLCNHHVSFLAWKVIESMYLLIWDTIKAVMRRNNYHVTIDRLHHLPQLLVELTHIIEAARPRRLVSLVFHNSRWWGLRAFSSLPLWCNCLTLTFPIATGRDCTSYQGCHAMMSSQPRLSQQSLVKFMGLLITTTLMQLFNSDFPHSRRQGLHKLLRLPCCNVQPALSFTTATGEVYESPHCHHPDAIIQLWLSP